MSVSLWNELKKFILIPFMLMIHFCLLKTNKSRVIMTKYDSILLPNTYIISKHSANTTLYHLLSSLNLTLLFVFRFCDQNCFRSRVPTVSLTIGPDHTPILVCHSIISKNKLQIFLSQRLWQKHWHVGEVRGGRGWDWNEAVTKHELIVTIWAKVSLYSLHPLLPLLTV